MENEPVQPNAETTQPSSSTDREAGTQSNASVTFTPEQQALLNSLMANARAEERRKAYRHGDPEELVKKAAAYDELEAAKMTELEKLQQSLAAKDAEIVAAKAQAETERLNALRLRVGQEIGLPPVLAARLQGADETELKADAEAVKAVLGQGATTVPNLNATAGGGQSSPRATVNLTPQQRAIADMYNMSYEDYAKSLKQFEE